MEEDTIPLMGTTTKAQELGTRLGNCTKGSRTENKAWEIAMTSWELRELGSFSDSFSGLWMRLSRSKNNSLDDNPLEGHNYLNHFWDEYGEWKFMG